MEEKRVYYIKLKENPLTDNEIQDYVEEVRQKLKQAEIAEAEPDELIGSTSGVLLSRTLNLEDRIEFTEYRMERALRNEFYEAAHFHLNNIIRFRNQKILRDFC